LDYVRLENGIVRKVYSGRYGYWNKERPEGPWGKRSGTACLEARFAWGTIRERSVARTPPFAPSPSFL